MNHNFQLSILQTRASLGTIIKQVQSLVCILDTYKCIDRIVVASHQFISFPLPSGSIVTYSLLHFQPIGISVEHSFIVDMRVSQSKHHFFALAIFNVDTVDMRFHLHHIAPTEPSIHFNICIEFELGANIIVVESVYSKQLNNCNKATHQHSAPIETRIMFPFSI